MENDNEYRPVDGEEDDESDGSPVKRKPKSSRPETTTSTEDHGMYFQNILLLNMNGCSLIPFCSFQNHIMHPDIF
jgi:hypothetical protein